MKFIIVALVLVAYASGEISQEQKLRWQNFKLQHGKMFLSVNKEQQRMETYLQNVAEVDAINQKFLAGESSFTAQEYQFHDLSTEEFRAKYTGAVVDNNTITQMAPTMRQSPKKCIDLRQTGEVNAVRSQGQCGSCWTFSTTAATESCYYRKTRQSVDLSEQQMVDCVYPRDGCKGGWVPTAVDWLKNNGGQTTESAIPYTGAYTGNCKKASAALNPTSSLQIPADTNSIKNALNQYGTLAATVNADGWKNYRGGLYSQGSAPAAPNHAVNLVGYGSDQNGQEYWLIRNSWGASWGENGYIRLNMNAGKLNSMYPENTFAVQC